MGLESVLGQTPESKRNWLESKRERILDLIKKDTRSAQGYCGLATIVRSIEEMSAEDLAAGKAMTPERIDYEDLESFFATLRIEGLLDSENGRFKYTGE